MLATMESAYFKLLLGDHEGTKAAIDQSQKILDQLDSVDLVVHASFYRVSGDYFKVRPCWGECGGLRSRLTSLPPRCFACRPRPSLRTTTRTRCCTWRA